MLEDVAVHEYSGPPQPPGTVLSADADGIAVACGGPDALLIRQLVPEGRRSMSAAEFLRGNLVMPGMRFSTAPMHRPDLPEGAKAP